MTFDFDDNVQISKDERGNVQVLDHLQQPFVAPSVSPQSLSFDGSASPSNPAGLADQYLRQVASAYGIDQNMLSNAVSSNGFSAAAASSDGKLELVDEKEIMGTTTVSYQQTYEGLPVWKAGVSVTVQSDPLRVTASQSSVHKDINIASTSASLAASSSLTAVQLKKLLNITGANPKITSTRKLIYQYDPDRRIDPEVNTSSGGSFESGPPTLPLPELPPQIQAGEHYVVTEVLFSLAVEDVGPINWRAFIEEQTGAVLYLRALIACAAGQIFRSDPLTAGAGVAVTPNAGAAALNPFRSIVTLEGLTAGNPQGLRGQFVRLVDSETPVVAAPTSANPPANFFFDAPSREFAAANAYHHCDGLFRLMQGMGFNLGSYFDGTAFPVPVDACAFNDVINARAPGNATGTGSGGFLFGLAGTPFPAVSIAADVRVVLHEFGHTILWDSVHSPNFGFAHSAGDSLAAILMDPESALRADPVRRFHTFPWILPDRQHGRDVATGWAWGGANDVGGYSSEQILSTTHFRIYRSLGGDSTDVVRRKMAARQAVYLIFRAIGSLATNPVTPTPNPGTYATSLMNADIGTANFEGYRGGAFHKVIRWSFEKQGLFQAPGAPVPVKKPGAPPKVDVYINDGVDFAGNQRNGEYMFQPVHWECKDIWNRLSATPGGGGGVHETPIVGRTNFAFVRVKNRGTQAATDVAVRGYSADPGAGLSWPGDWKPMLTPQLNMANIPAGGEVIVGPFKWRPMVVGHECMFMEASTAADRSNIDPATFFPSANGPTPEWRVVPFDNNIGQRNVAPVAGGGGIRGLLSSFIGRKFKVRNPSEKSARYEIKAELPKLLAERGWRAILDQREMTLSFGLGPGASRNVMVELKPGGEFTADQVKQARGANIRLSVFADGNVIGGMTYELDPALDRAPREQVGAPPIGLDDAEIEEAIRNAQEDGEAIPVENTKEDDGTGVPAKVENPANTTAWILSQLNLLNEGNGKVKRISLRKVLLEVDLED
jgi:zinc metalloprotease ZmpB